VPLAFAEALMDAKGLRTSIEVKTTNGESVEEVQDQLKKLLGKRFTIQNQDQQHSYLYKAVKIEKLITYFILTCLLAIASLNLLLTLTMMTQNKKHDIATLKTIGAGERMIRLIFLCEGAIIGLFSGVFGLLIGAGLCYLQQQFGFIRINADSGFSSYYPVKMEAVDFGVALLTTIGISLLFSIGPAIQASKITIKDHI
jgi:lipoprotein-releasing system permease protein